MERGRLGLTAHVAPNGVRGPLSCVKLSAAMVLCLACASTPEAEPTPRVEVAVRVAHSDGWIAMGTFFEIEVRVLESQREELLDWIEEARGEIARLERIYSRHDSTSELSALNRHRAESGDGDAPFLLSPELSGLLAEAERLNRATDGTFDVAIDPVILDLDAISKGAVLDHLRTSFTARFRGAAALFSFGQSSVVAIGDPDGQGWRLKLQSRDSRRGFLGTVRLHDQSLSMSSSLGRAEDADSTNESHIIDPRTGRSVVGAIEAVVVSDSALDADAWSTALVVSGRIPDRLHGHSRVDLEAMLIDGSGNVYRTPGWSGSIWSLEKGN